MMRGMPMLIFSEVGKVAWGKGEQRSPTEEKEGGYGTKRRKVGHINVLRYCNDE